MDPGSRLPGIGEGSLRLIMLLLADGSGCHAATVIAGGVQRKGSPTSTDFEDVIFGSQAQLATDPVELLLLGFFERIIGVLVNRAGVDHVAVQKEAEEIVVQVVVRLDIAAAASQRIAVQSMTHPMEEAADQGKKRIASFELGKIVSAKAYHRNGIWRGPVAIDIGIPRCIVTSPQNPGKETLVVNGNGRPQAGARFPKEVGLFRADHFQRAVAHLLQHPEYSFSRKTCTHVHLVSSFIGGRTPDW